MKQKEVCKELFDVTITLLHFVFDQKINFSTHQTNVLQLNYFIDMSYFS